MNPGYTIETHGPDDRIDAAVMAVTEATSGGPRIRWLPLSGEGIGAGDLAGGWTKIF